MPIQGWDETPLWEDALDAEATAVATGFESVAVNASHAYNMSLAREFVAKNTPTLCHKTFLHKNCDTGTVVWNEGDRKQEYLTSPSAEPNWQHGSPHPRAMLSPIAVCKTRMPRSSGQ